MLNLKIILFSIISIAFSVLSFPGYGQEVIRPLNHNPILKLKAQERNFKEAILYKKEAIQDTLDLPFSDDFSGTEVYPDNKLWLDSNVYINDNFPYKPLSVGVATFDGLNKFGEPYYSLAPKVKGVGDYLTSKPINLKEKNGIPYSLSDSIYMSFVYQPQGLGNAPQTDDSLVLEFKVPGDTIWQHVWSAPGSLVQPFKTVLIPLKDAAYLKKGFQFRFKNYISFSGNIDHWNIDYVYFNKNRSYKETVIPDLSLTGESRFNALKDYSSMPWQHFLVHPDQELKQADTLRITNNYNSIKTLYSKTDIKNSSGAILFSTPQKGVRDIPGLSSRLDTVDFASMAAPLFPPTSVDSAEFTIEHMIVSANDMFPRNDTLRKVQKFYNYYAYDDGSAEALYGLQEEGGKIAYKFDCRKKDSLQAVGMFFSRSIEDVSLRTFKLTVWSSLSPETIVYQGNDTVPVYENTVNGYAIYRLKKPVVISGTFYVGWVQQASAYNLGIDLNTPGNNRYYYTFNTGWVQSIQPGAWMIRPMFGKRIPLISDIHELSSPIVDLTIYPNPAKDKLYISYPEEEVSNPTFIVSDFAGRVILTSSGKEPFIDLSTLSNGFYLVKMNHSAGSSVVKKLLIAK